MDLQRVYDILLPRLRASERLEKQASTDALITKAGTDLATLGLLKQAAGPLMKGLMYGAGAAIPAGLVGAGLISHAGRESRKTVEDVRNKALQAALGIAALGGGLYALHRTMGKPKDEAGATTDNMMGWEPDLSMYRYASAKEDPAVLVEKLATVAFLDTLLDDQRTQGKEETLRRKAAECQLLNAEHGVDLLRQLLD